MIGASLAFLNGATATFRGNRPGPAAADATAILEIMGRGYFQELDGGRYWD